MRKLGIAFTVFCLLCLTCSAQSDSFLIFFRDKKYAAILTVFYLEKQNPTSKEKGQTTIVIDHNKYSITIISIPSFGSEMEACCETDTLGVQFGINQLVKLYRKLGESKQDSLVAQYDKLCDQLKFDGLKHFKLTRVDMSMDIYSMSIVTCKCLKQYFSNDLRTYYDITCLKSLGKAYKLTKNEKKYFRANFDIIAYPLKKQRDSVIKLWLPG